MTGSSTTVIAPFIAGKYRDGEAAEIVRDKFTDEPVAQVLSPSREQVTEAIGALVAAQRATRLDPPNRYDILHRASELLRSRHAEAVSTIIADTGFTVADADREAVRTAQTLLNCAEEAKRVVGEIIPLNAVAGQQSRFGLTIYRPLGVVCAIIPFNSPLNAIAHKVGPAIAAGNAAILKPASATPQTARFMLEILLEAGLPPELISVVFGPGRTVGRWLTEDERPAFYAFTGSTEVGIELQRAAGLRPTQLELGSISSTIICADANLAQAVPRAVNASFRKAGQVCTSVQRLYVHSGVLGEVTQALAAALHGKRYGDPADTDTFVGPLISPSEARRVKFWCDDAVRNGAEVVTGATLTGNVIAPTVLAGVASDDPVMRKEIFGPVIALREFTDLRQAIDEINDTPYGLAAGIFTRDIDQALMAADRLRMGSIHINETSSNRVDLMPYGGVKSSGHGKEGPRYAIREMSEERLITIGPAEAA